MPVPERPKAVCRLDTPEAAVLADLAMAFDDLQYVLLCCEQLITAICGPATVPIRIETHSALVEALWTGALVGYTRCFSPKAGVLTDADVTRLELEGDVAQFHATIKKLRSHYVSLHVNPRDDVSIGMVLDGGDVPQGIAVTSAPRPTVDDTTVRTLGRLVYALSALVDSRMRQAQQVVLEAGLTMTPEDIRRLPQVLIED